MEFGNCSLCNINTFLYSFNGDNLCTECFDTAKLDLVKRLDPVASELNNEALQSIMDNSLSVMQFIYKVYLENCVQDNVNPFYGPHAEEAKNSVKDVAFQSQVASIILVMRNSISTEED